MDPTSDRSTLAGRLASFDGSVQVSKRRASSTKKKQISTVSWPHQTPTPLQLARAGFFYKPSASSIDSVTCFLCDKALDGWEPGDNPLLEHLAHVPDCGWAINTCIEMRSQELDRAEEDPRSMEMVNARKATFRDRWPHEGKKGWKCKVDKMIDAGWSYDPLPEADDCVKCFYCGVCLDGWEPTDDPWDEHQRRSPDCHFFTLIEDARISTKMGKPSRRRTSRLSKVSRLSTQSVTGHLLQLELTNLHEENISQIDDTMLTTTSRNSLTGKATKKQGKRLATSKTGRKAIKKLSSARDEEQGGEISSNLVTLDAGAILLTEHQTVPEGTKGRRITRRAASQTIAFSEKSKRVGSTVEEEDVLSPPKKATRTRTSRKKQAELSVDPDQVQTEHRDDDAGNLRSQDTILHTKIQWENRLEEVGIKLDNSIIMLDAQTLPSSAERPTRGKKRMSDSTEKSQALFTARHESSYPQTTIEYADASEESPAAMKTTNLQKPLLKLPEPHSINDRENISPKTQESLEQKQTRIKNVVELGRRQFEPHDLVQPAIQAGEAHNLRAEPSTAQDHGFEVASSQQSSDAENHPPSSRQSLFATSAVQRLKSPVDATEQLATPKASPSRVNSSQRSALYSSAPWSNVDLETILLASPLTQHFRGAALASSMEATLHGLSSAEKEMSVQEWILWNARQAEDGLKGECERLINVFEREGVRALHALEGIECS